MKKPLFCLVTALAVQLCVLLSPALAHYLWVIIDAKAGQHGTANVYFEEGPAPRDGRYLDPFVERGRTWIRTVESSEPLPLEIADVTDSGKRWLSAKLPSATPRSVESYGMWGVYRYGSTDVLLYYYARHVDARNSDDLRAVARAEQLALDIVPHSGPDGALELTVLWHGKPATGRKIYVRGPKGFRQDVTTDDKGRASLQPSAAGRYLMRTNVEEKDRSGTQDGKEYQMVRHHATLTMNLPLR